jgi:glycine/D-amino acid oxidase-like deaminating enzyme
VLRVSAKPSFAVIGAGIGGLAVGALLARQDAKVTIYEQAKQFLRIGAGIQMRPDAMRLLRAFRRELLLCKLAFGRPGGPGTRTRATGISSAAARGCDAGRAKARPSRPA